MTMRLNHLTKPHKVFCCWIPLVVRVGFGPTKAAKPRGLQPLPFDRSGTSQYFFFKLDIEVTLPFPHSQNVMCDFHTDVQFFCALDKTQTCTSLRNNILSVACLSIPPQGQKCVVLSSFIGEPHPLLGAVTNV